jgi:hypothetical protein
MLNFLAWKVYTLKRVNSLLAIAIWAAILQWYCIPGLIAALYQQDTPFISLYRYSKDNWFTDFFATYSLEAVAICTILTTLILLLKAKRKHSKEATIGTSAYPERTYKISNRYKKLVLVIFGLTLIYHAFNFQADYQLNNSAELYSAGKGTVEVILDAVSSLSFYAVTLIALQEKKSFLVLRFAFAMIIASAIMTATQGGRIDLLAPVYIYIFRRIILGATEKSQDGIPGEHRQKSPSKAKSRIQLISTVLLSTCMLWFVFIPIAQSLQDARSQGSINWSEVVETAYLNDNSRVAAELILGKLDSFTTAAILIQEEGLGSGGINPYIGSLLVFIPRSIMPSRPIAGTTDGTIYTHPTRIVPISVGIQSDSLNVGISPLHVAMWHFGYLGFPIFVIAISFYLRAINWLLNSRSFLFNVFGMFSISIPTFADVFPSPDVALKNIVVISLLVILVKTLKYFLLNKDKRQASQLSL